MLECCHQLWTPRFCQPSLGLGSQNIFFSGLRWLQSLHIQLPAAAATASTDPDPVPLSGIKESLLERSATNANQGCFDACESMIKKDGRQYSERENISREKNENIKMGQKYLP
jgi:hypothetical protein